MTTLTKEQLISHARESVSYLEDLKGRVSKEGADCKVVIEMVARDLKLARIALASLEAKPIGAFHIAEQQVDGTSDYIKDGEWPIDNGIIEVYAVPPVPVIQADVAQAIENLKQKLVECNRYNYCADAVKGVEDACHAAMLQSQDNGIKDGWISCSERMPEIRQTVMGWNGYAVRQCVYTRNGYAKTQKGREPRFETSTGIWHGVTHWMPLPEPPQESKSE
ncbi:DUF551 domain-containing protein [Escherichia coli]|uniref:DUF551 domain-containing protein n=1 Tax=Escherichia coli TaxID=562 RepID=UPI0030CDB0C5